MIVAIYFAFLLTLHSNTLEARQSFCVVRGKYFSPNTPFSLQNIFISQAHKNVLLALVLVQTIFLTECLFLQQNLSLCSKLYCLPIKFLKKFNGLTQCCAVKLILLNFLILSIFFLHFAQFILINYHLCLTFV